MKAVVWDRGIGFASAEDIDSRSQNSVAGNREKNKFDLRWHWLLLEDACFWLMLKSKSFYSIAYGDEKWWSVGFFPTSNKVQLSYTFELFFFCPQAKHLGQSETSAISIFQEFVLCALLTKVKSPHVVECLPFPFTPEEHHDTEEFDSAVWVEASWARLRFDGTPTVRDCNSQFVW